MRGGSMGGGFRSGGFGGGFAGGGFNRGFAGGGFNRGFAGGGFRGFNGFGGFRNRGFIGFRGIHGFGAVRSSAFFGLGFGFGGFGWPGFYGGYWPGYYSDYLPADYGYGYGGGYASPAVTVVYPPPQSSGPVYVERANPVTREYDQYGQETRGGAADSSGSVAARSSPIYLIAFQDHVIRAAAAYWVDHGTLHYVTLEHEEKQAPIENIDRALTLQLNRERRIPIQIP